MRRLWRRGERASRRNDLSGKEKITDVDSERLEALRNLPKEVLDLMTREEVKAFLYKDEWPESLREKLKDYLEEDS